VVFGATLLPWARTGRAARSGLGLARSLRTTGFVNSGPRAALFVAIELIPALLAAAFTAVAFGRRRWSALLALIAATIAMGAAVVALSIHSLHPLAGLAVTMVAAGCTMALAIAALILEGMSHVQ